MADETAEPKKAQKQFHVSFEFQELPSAHIHQTVRVEASDMGLAVHRGLKEVRKRKIVKGRRLHSAKISVVEIRDIKE